ncbi:ComEC/Rec2 family competence protein [Microbacterium sp. NPDC090007]|uniref:ComEC/Rec2 family competence protein n=1 Tax=Microbacterium sp. NPDC090007 TaxID=3364204 RepID=UPI003830DD6F
MSERGALRRRALRSVVVAAITWAAAGTAVSMPDPRPLTVVLGGAAVISLAALARRRSVAVTVLTVALAFAAAAAAGVAATVPTRATLDEARLTGGRALTVTATVTGRVDVRPDGSAWFDAVAEEVTAGAHTMTGAVPARVAVTADARDALRPVGLGSTVTVTGRAVPADPTARALLWIRADTVQRTTSPPGVWGALEDVRRGLVHSTAGLPQPGAGLVPGLAVGDTSLLDSGTEAAMNASSLSHLTAVSGANCAIVVGAAFAVLALCGASRAVRIAGAAIVLAGFVALVTPEPSVIRAAVMALVALLALSLGRPAVGVAVLSLAVTALLVIDPWLSLSIGFALSAAATGALLTLARPLARGLTRWMPRALGLAIAVPLSAQLVCGPLIVLIDPHVPLLGVVANMLADPAAAPATIAGALACIAPFPWLRDGLTALVWVPATWIAAVAHATAGIAAQNLPWPDGAFGAALLSAVSAATALAIIAPPRWRRTSVLAALTVAVVTGLLAGLTAVRTVAGPLTLPASWQVAMCDVGQGDATLWRSGSAVALVDTGPEPDALDECLTRFGIDRLDLVVLTHFDLDHVGGSPAILGRATTVVHGPVGEPADQRLLDDFAQAGARLVSATPGMSGTVGATRWQALGPLPRVEPGNDASVALDVVGAGFPRTVLLGDLGEEPQEQLLRRVDVPRVDVVKVSHHGSADQDPELYRRLHAAIGLIGVGADNRYGHPTASLLEILRSTGTVVGRTDREGALAVWTGEDGGLRLWRERSPVPFDPPEPTASTAPSVGPRGPRGSRRSARCLGSRWDHPPSRRRSVMHPHTEQPLTGVKVIELGSLIAGPMAGRVFADFGADVIKVENPRSPDPMRVWGRVRDGERSLWWAVQSRGKRFVALDLKDAEDLATVRALLDEADVLVENFRPGTLERLGLGPDTLWRTNPGLVIARVSGYGQTGPMAHKAGYAAVAEATGGLRHLNGYPGQAPPRTGISLGDALASLYAVQGVLTALYWRDARGGGRGQIVDVSLVESCFSMLEGAVAEYGHSGVVGQPSGSRLDGIAPSNIYRSSDDTWVVIAANQDTVFRRLCHVMGTPDLADDERFVDHASRGAHQDDLDAVIAAWAATLPAAELEKRLETGGVPASLVNSIAEIYDAELFRAREMIVPVVDDEGVVQQPGIVPKLSVTPGRIRRNGSAVVGKDDAQVLAELGEQS